MTGAALRCQGLIAGDAGLLEQAAAAHVFAKPDISARAQLAAEVARHHAG